MKILCIFYDPILTDGSQNKCRILEKSSREQFHVFKEPFTHQCFLQEMEKFYYGLAFHSHNGSILGA